MINSIPETILRIIPQITAGQLLPVYNVFSGHLSCKTPFGFAGFSCSAMWKEAVNWSDNVLNSRTGRNAIKRKVKFSLPKNVNLNLKELGGLCLQ